MFGPIQESFARALLDPERPVPGALVSHTAAMPAKRFAVYRNNVVVGLVRALARRFPAVECIVGAEFFAVMARAYVMKHPPRSPVLMVYGDAFPDFIERFAPAAALAYLPDVARLEAARTRAYHAADARPVDPALLQSIEPAAVGALRIVPHPSAEIVRSLFPVVTIWGMNAGGIELGPIEDWSGEDALVVRPGLEVEVRALPPGGAAFLAGLFSGAPLADAAETALDESADFDLVANLAGLIGSGAVTEVLLAGSLKETSS